MFWCSFNSMFNKTFNVFNEKLCEMSNELKIIEISTCSFFVRKIKKK